MSEVKVDSLVKAYLAIRLERDKLAKKYHTINAHLERLINLVLQARNKVKNTTQLSSRTTSVSYAAVQYIIQNIPIYNSKNILVF